MEYFFLKHSTNIKIIGDVNSPCHKISPDSNYNVNEPYSYRFLRAFTESIDDFRLPAYILEHKAKWTDMISVINLTYSNLVLSKNFVKLLQGFNIPKHEQHPVKINKRGAENIYQLFHFLEGQDHLVDFTLSEFYLKQRRKITREGIKFQDLNDYLKQTEILQKEYGRSSSYKAQKIYFKSLHEYDLLFFKSLYGVTIISERLKEAIETAGITGVDISQLDDYKKIDFKLISKA